MRPFQWGRFLCIIWWWKAKWTWDIENKMNAKLRENYTERWCRVWWHSTNDGGREAGGVALRHLRRPLHHPPHPHHRGQLQQVGDLAAPQTKTDAAPRPASVIDVLYAACLFLFLHQMFCIDVTVTSFAEYGIKYNKGHIAFLTILRDAHTIENG